MILLHLQYECSQENVKLPWDKVAERMGEPVTTSSLLQHLAKVRERREEAGKPVPPPLPRAKKRMLAKEGSDDDKWEDDEKPPEKKPRVPKPNVIETTNRATGRGRSNSNADKGNKGKGAKLIIAKKEKGVDSKSAVTGIIKTEPEEKSKLQETKSTLESDSEEGSGSEDDGNDRLCVGAPFLRFGNHAEKANVSNRSRSPGPEKKSLIITLKVPSLKSGAASKQTKQSPAPKPRLTLPRLAPPPAPAPAAVKGATQFVPHDVNSYVVDRQPQLDKNSYALGSQTQFGTKTSVFGSQTQFDIGVGTGMSAVAPWGNMQAGFMPAIMNNDLFFPQITFDPVNEPTAWMLADNDPAFMNPATGPSLFNDGTVDPAAVNSGANLDCEFDSFVNFDQCGETWGNINDGEVH